MFVISKVSIYSSLSWLTKDCYQNGLLGNRCRHEKLARCRALLVQPEPEAFELESVEAMMARLVGVDIQLCPVCRQGKLRVIAELAPIRTFPPIPKATGPPL